MSLYESLLNFTQSAIAALSSWFRVSPLLLTLRDYATGVNDWSPSDVSGSEPEFKEPMRVRSHRLFHAQNSSDRSNLPALYAVWVFFQRLGFTEWLPLLACLPFRNPAFSCLLSLCARLRNRPSSAHPHRPKRPVIHRPGRPTTEDFEHRS